MATCVLDAYPSWTNTMAKMARAYVQDGAFAATSRGTAVSRTVFCMHHLHSEKLVGADPNKACDYISKNIVTNSVTKETLAQLSAAATTGYEVPWQPIVAYISRAEWESILQRVTSAWPGWDGELAMSARTAIASLPPTGLEDTHNVTELKTLEVMYWFRQSERCCSDPNKAATVAARAFATRPITPNALQRTLAEMAACG